MRFNIGTRSTRYVVLLASVLFAANLDAEEQISPGHSSPILLGLLHEVLAADAPDRAALAYGKLFQNVGPQDIGILLAHPNDGIAIQAAWQEVLLTIPENAAHEPTVPHGWFYPDRRRLDWFLGFLEGRLRAQSPKWWADMLSTARARDRYNVSFGIPQDAKGDNALLRSLYHFAGLENFMAPRNTTMKRREDRRIVLQVGEESLLLPTAFLNAIQNDAGDWYYFALSPCVTPARCYIAAHGPHECLLVCVDRTSSRMIWKSDVWGASFPARGGGGAGPFVDQVTVTELNGRVTVFGYDGGVYVEAFRSDDGSNIARFSNAYGRHRPDKR